MRHLGRTHGISITWLHDEVGKPSCNLSYIATKYMAADIFTKFYPTDKHIVWNAVRRLINVLDPGERDRMIGFSGEGWRCQHVRTEGKVMSLHEPTGELLSVWPRPRKIGDKIRRKDSTRIRNIVTSEHSLDEVSFAIYRSLPLHFTGQIVCIKLITGNIVVPNDTSGMYVFNPYRVESIAYTPGIAPPVRIMKHSRVMVPGGTRISSGKRTLVLVGLDTPLDLVSFDQSSVVVYP